MTDTIVFSRPRPEDLAEIVALLGDHLGAHYHMRADDPRAVALMEAYARGERKSGVIARSGAHVAGFVLYDLTPLFSPTGVQARADYGVVAPAFRKRGLMRELLHRSWQQAASEGAELFLHKSSVPVMIDLFRRMPEAEERGSYFFVQLPHTPEEK